MSKKVCIIISSNRYEKLPPETVNIIDKTKTTTFFVKQQLKRYYTNHPHIVEICTNTKGVSNGRNMGIKKALSQGFRVFGFTDDDCIITTQWINRIKNNFESKKIDLIFGRTLPYQPSKHPKQTCPCTFSRTDNIPISKIVSNWEKIGISNNFATSYTLIKKIKGFTTWIGPGTKIPGAEDGDFIIRAILQGFVAHYDHNMLIYHNKWLNPTNVEKLYYDYTFGHYAVYFYHSLKGSIDCFRVISLDLLGELSNYVKYIKFIKSPLRMIYLIHDQNLKIYYFIKGILYGSYYFLTKK